MKYVRITALFFTAALSSAFPATLSALAQFPGVDPTKNVAAIGKGGDLDAGGFSHSNIAASSGTLGNTALGEILVAGVALEPAEVVQPTAELPTSGTPGFIGDASRNYGMSNVSCSVISYAGYVTFNTSNSAGSASSTNPVSGAVLAGGGTYTPGDCTIGAGSALSIQSNPYTYYAGSASTGCISTWQTDGYGHYLFASSYFCQATSPSSCSCAQVL